MWRVEKALIMWLSGDHIYPLDLICIPVAYECCFMSFRPSRKLMPVWICSWKTILALIAQSKSVKFAAVMLFCYVPLSCRSESAMNTWNVSTYCTSIIIQHWFFYCWKLNFWYWQFLQNRHSVDVGKGSLPGSIRKWALICCLHVGPIVLKQHEYCTCHWMYYRYSTADSDWGRDIHENNYVTAHNTYIL